MQSTAEAFGANCTVGGLKLEAGLDVSNNGVLEAAEVGNTSYFCNVVSTTVLNTIPTAVGVSISHTNGGVVEVGDTLTGNYTYADVDNDPEGTSTFRWLRSGLAIADATSSSYTLITADANQTLTFEVTPMASTGMTSGNPVTSSGVSSNNSAPTASNVRITDWSGGTMVIGETLSGSYTYADADNDAQGISTFRWLRNGSAITNATLSNYMLVAADADQTLTFEVTPKASTGMTLGNPVISNAVFITNSAPTASNVSITDTNGGNVVAGDSLSGSYTYADVDNDVEGTSTFRWLRNGSAITNATLSSYTLVSADAGQTLSFEVTPIASTGTTSGSPVTATGVSVTNSAPTASNVSITDTNGGNIVAGDTLTGNYTYADTDNDLEGTSTFRWLRNGSAISNATSSSYTLVSDDADQTLTFEVTPTASTGMASGIPVTSDGISVTNSAPTASNVTIVDTNGGSIVAGDSLSGSYSYSDIDNDGEGASRFRWLRNGVSIPGASASSYTLVADDSGKSIIFEVTPVASTGTGTGNTITSNSVLITALENAGYFDSSTFDESTFQD